MGQKGGSKSAATAVRRPLPATLTRATRHKNDTVDVPLEAASRQRAGPLEPADRTRAWTPVIGGSQLAEFVRQTPHTGDRQK